MTAREVARAAPQIPWSAPGYFIRALLEQHFLKHWTVSDRATNDADAFEPPHPGRPGHAASHQILDRIIRGARRNLAYTNLPIWTIAYALGFNVSRFFSSATERSPRSFRRARPYGVASCFSRASSTW